jgi:hypothetical protein
MPLAPKYTTANMAPVTAKMLVRPNVVRRPG